MKYSDLIAEKELVGARIAAARGDESVKALAERADVDRTSILGWESGRREGNYRDVSKVALAVNLTPNELFLKNPLDAFAEMPAAQIDRDALVAVCKQLNICRSFDPSSEYGPYQIWAKAVADLVRAFGLEEKAQVAMLEPAKLPKVQKPTTAVLRKIARDSKADTFESGQMAVQHPDGTTTLEPKPPEEKMDLRGKAASRRKRA